MDVHPIHLADVLDRADVQAAGSSHVEVQTFVIHRVARTVVFQHPPSRIEWPEIELSDQPRIEAFLAIKPFVWERIGAPVLFRIGVLDPGGRETTLLEREMDARNRKEDRAWAPVEASLEPWRGRKVRLVFETLGQRGPVSFGWCGWGDPIVLGAAVTRKPGSPATVAVRSAAGQPDIFLVTCDALRMDHLGCYGAAPGATPHLDAFAAEAVQVGHARATSDSTLASFASLLTGRLPHETGVTAEWGAFPAHLPSLPVMLSGAGYHTIAAFSEMELGDSGVGVGQLFAEKIPCLGNPAQHSSLTVRRLAERLQAADPGPLFVWLQLFEPHPPSIPEPSFPAGFASDPSQPFHPEAVRAIHGIESALELVSCESELSKGRVPSSLLHRLEETVRALRGELPHGPDLASYLDAVGSAAWNDMGRAPFLGWLTQELQAVRRSEGAGSGPLLAWLRQLTTLLRETEADLISWLEGVEDFRYPEALYAASVKSVDHAFGSLVAKLRELGRYEYAVIVFTSPHGELLRAPPLIFEHHALHEEVLRVPMLVKPPGSSGWRPGGRDIIFGLERLGATLLDYAGVPATGSLSREHSRRESLAGDKMPTTVEESVAVSMQGLAACLHRPPFKLLRFHEDGVSWPWLPKGVSFRRGEAALFYGEAGIDDTEDVSARYPDAAKRMAEELERLAPLGRFLRPSLETARLTLSEEAPGEHGAPTSQESGKQSAHPRSSAESDLPEEITPLDVRRLVQLEIHQAELERELRDSEDRRSAAEQFHRVDTLRIREMRREAQRLRKDLKQLTRWLDQIGANVTKLYGTRRWRLGSWLRILRKGVVKGAGFPALDAILQRFADWRKGVVFDARELDGGELSHLHWLRAQSPDAKRQRAMVAQLEWLEVRPNFGLIMTVPATANAKLVAEAVASVLGQSYGAWQLGLLHANAGMRARLPQDGRIKVLDTSSLPEGVTHVAAMGAEDLLEPHALMELALHIGMHAKPSHLIYTDEDEIGPSGALGNPFLKPAWSPETLESCNYVGALAVYEREFLHQLGADAGWLGPERAYDTVLRAAEQPGFRAERLPRLLCHRRRPEPAARGALLEVERRALVGAMQRRGEVADVRETPGVGTFRVLRSIWKQEKVVIMIPTRDRLALLRRAVDSVMEKTAYRNFELVIINNESRDPETLAWLARSGHRVFDFAGPFNYAAMHNAAVRATDEPWLLFLNNDTEVIEPTWLTAMAEHVQRPEIGAVGARLLFPDGTVQHAGVVLGIQERAAHAFANRRPDDLSARAQLQMVRNYSAVTAACMMMRREVYVRIGGMDAERFAVAYNDVELCVRATRFGYRNVVTPHAVLKHHECASRPRRDYPHEVESLRHLCFGADGWTDPFYHPALNRQQADFTVYPVGYK